MLRRTAQPEVMFRQQRSMRWAHRLRIALGDPQWHRRINGWLTVAWALLAVPSMLWWKDSIPYLVGLSVYAVVTGHLASWQSARTEVRQLDADDQVDPGESL
jgi:hypothetical protein